MFEGLDPSKADVVRASICSVDHGVGLASQFVMQSPIDQPSDDLGSRLSTFDDVVGNATRFPTLSEGAVHGLDDVAAHAEVAQVTLGLEADHPFPGRSWCRKTHLLQMLEAANHQAPGLGIGAAGIVGAKIDVAGFVSCQPDFVIEPRPSLCRDFPLQRITDFMLWFWTQFDRDQFLSAGAQTPADIVAGDDEISALFVDTPNEKMDVRVICVPVIDGHPVELRAEINLHLPDEVAGESPEVGHIAGVLGRDDKPKMMAVVLAAFRESRPIGTVGASIEHLGPLTTPGHPIALQV
jgi:hypothetical protein